MLHTASHFFPSAALTKMQTLSCNNIVGIVYLIWYTSEQITCIFCTIYACKRIAIRKCQPKNREKEVKGEKGKESDKENSVNRKVDRNNYEIDAIFNIYGTQIVQITAINKSFLFEIIKEFLSIQHFPMDWKFLETNTGSVKTNLGLHETNRSKRRSKILRLFVLIRILEQIFWN